MAAGAIIAKVAGAVLSNEKGRELVLVLITAILMPIILLILVWIPLLSGTADANVTLVDCCFNGAAIPAEFTEEQCEAIEYMRLQLDSIDKIIAGKENAAEHESCPQPHNVLQEPNGK